MHRRWWAAAVAAIGIASGAWAAGPEEKPPGPTPPPETDKLSYFAGPWTTEGEIKPGPLGAGGPTQGREMCRWMPGKFFLACLMQTRTSNGVVVQMEGIMGYDADKKVYRWWSFDSVGRAETATGTLKDDAWTWVGESKVGDRTVQTRYTISDAKPDGYSYDWETSADGKAWTSMMTGKVAKMVPKPPATPAAHPVGTPPAMIRIPTPAPTPK